MASDGTRNIYSDEFVVSWEDGPRFISQPMGGTVDHNVDFVATYALNFTPFSCHVERYNDYLGRWVELSYGSAVWETIPAGHTCDIKSAQKVDPTCTEGGKEAYYKCEGCGKFYEDALGAKEIADLSAWGNIPAAGHKFGEYVYNNDATAVNDGTKTRSCSVCGKTETITASGTKWKNPFVDVKSSAFYYTPVLWASNSGITAGTTATTFAPNAACTRGQIVTFLWRAAGSPEPKGSNNPFNDVKSNQYYYKAALWAVENGITTGTSTTTFSPNAPCTRGQIVTFLWRSENSPDATASNPFNDVNSKAYYYDAVLWAVENEITTGTSATTFSPNDPCTRGQIVTFLYRYYN